MGCVVRLIMLRSVVFSNASSEPECCDGSDEPAGVCQNACKEIGAAYKERIKAEHKLRKTVGSLFKCPIHATHTSFRAPRSAHLTSLSPKRRKSG